MFAKLATVIIVLGAMFGALLVNRQERIDTAAEISRIHFKLEKQERERTRREAKVATSVIPFRSDPSSATEEALRVPQLVTEPDTTDTEQELGG